MATTTDKNIKGLVKLTVKEIGNKKHPRPVSSKPFPLIHKSQTFLANSLTSGVTEAQVKDLVKATGAYYDIKYVFYPSEDTSKPGTKSNDFSLESLELLAGLLGSQDLKTFTESETREEVLTWLKDFVNE